MSRALFATSEYRDRDNYLEESLKKTSKINCQLTKFAFYILYPIEALKGCVIYGPMFNKHYLQLLFFFVLTLPFFFAPRYLFKTIEIQFVYFSPQTCQNNAVNMHIT
jgi:hypothetical protein